MILNFQIMSEFNFFLVDVSLECEEILNSVLPVAGQFRLVGTGRRCIGQSNYKIEDN
jgi:hypothetical protein